MEHGIEIAWFKSNITVRILRHISPLGCLSSHRDCGWPSSACCALVHFSTATFVSIIRKCAGTQSSESTAIRLTEFPCSSAYTCRWRWSLFPARFTWVSLITYAYSYARRLYRYVYTVQIYREFRALLALHIWHPFAVFAQLTNYFKNKYYNCDAIDLLPIETSNAFNIAIVIAHHNSTCLRECTIITPTDLPPPPCDFELLPYVFVHLKNEHHSGTHIAIDVCSTHAAISSTAIRQQQSTDISQALVSSTVYIMQCNFVELFGSGR